MSWHRTPKGDEWRKVTLASIEALGQRIWLRCNDCGHDVMMRPRAFAEERGLDMGTPLFTVGTKLACSKCSGRKCHCWPAPQG